MLERVLEPEVMDDRDESMEYDEMDHAQVNRAFVEDLCKSGAVGPDVLDLGTGTARIPIELCLADLDCRVMASDAAATMLDIARSNIDSAGLIDRIQLHHADAKFLGFEDAMFDTVISNSLIHHLPNPVEAIKHMLRVVKPGGRVFVRDLFRPSDNATLEMLVERYCADETESSQQLFRQSLYAALTVEEMQDLVSQFGRSDSEVSASSDRHWTWSAEISKDPASR